MSMRIPGLSRCLTLKQLMCEDRGEYGRPGNCLKYALIFGINKDITNTGSNLLESLGVWKHGQQ